MRSTRPLSLALALGLLAVAGLATAPGASGQTARGARTASSSRPIPRSRLAEIARTAARDSRGGRDAAGRTAFLARHGLALATGTGVRAAPASRTTSAQDISMHTPSLYFDLNYHRYVASASYDWNTVGWEDNSGSVGGYDGFGMRFSHTMPNNSVYAMFSGRPVSNHYYGTTTPTNPSDNSSAGVTYRKQDYAHAISGSTDYNMWSGTVSMDLGVPVCNTDIYLTSRYVHTWSSTSLTGFTVAIDGFGFTWSNAGSSWSAASPVRTWRRAC